MDEPFLDDGIRAIIAMAVLLLVVGLLVADVSATITFDPPRKLEDVFWEEVQRAGLLHEADFLAAQVHQESTWRWDAQSPAGAYGSMQLLRGTADWLFPQTKPSCKGTHILDPNCNMRAGMLYMRRLSWAFRKAHSPADRRAFAQASFNGGQGWINKEVRRCRRDPRCDSSRYFGHVQNHCMRAAWACRENTEYPERIARLRDRYYSDW